MLPRIAAIALLFLACAGNGNAAPGEEETPVVSRVPVQILGADGRSQWFAVEVPVQQVPEPSALLLTAIAAAFFLRRRRL